MTTKKTIRISEDVTLPLEIVSGSIAILATKGAGKSYTAGVLAEEVHAAGVPFAMIDPTGAHSGLRSGADGGPKGGLPVVIFGGDTPDVPLQADRGREIATLLLRERFSAVLDLSLMHKPDAKRFVGDFSRQIYFECRHSFHVFYDECDWFIPQSKQHGDQECADAVADVVKLGRRRGLGSTLITQRAATANKDALSQCETLFALRTTHNLDVDQISDWLKNHVSDEVRKTVLGSLGALPKGTAWVLAPDEGFIHRTAIRKKRTFDSSKTPEPGETRALPVGRANVDLEWLRERFAGAIKASEANDPEKLRARIAELELELATAKSAVPQVEKELVPAVSDEVRKDLADACETLGRVAERILEGLGSLPSDGWNALPSLPPAPLTPEQVAGRAKSKTVGYTAPPVATPSDGHTRASNGLMLQPMIDMLASIGPVTKEQLACALGVSHTTGSFQQKLGAVQREGYAVRQNDLYGVTEMGEKKATKPDGAVKPPRVTRFLDFWLAKIEDSTGELLKAVIRSGPKGLSKEEGAEALGVSHTTGSFQQRIARLVQLDLAIRRDGRLYAGPQAIRRA